MVRLIECYGESSIMRRPWPIRGFWAVYQFVTVVDKKVKVKLSHNRPVQAQRVLGS